MANNKTKAHTKYITRDGRVVPSVTTIINDSLGWNKQQLIAWARKLALAGTDPNKARDEAADIGTLAHYLIQCHLQGTKPDTSQYSPANVDKAENCFLAYLEWEKGHIQKVIATEQQMVSEKYLYGGTADLVAIVDGELAIVDYKSSNGLYPEYKIQVAAYLKVYEEIEGVLPKGHLLQLGKEDGSFTHHCLGNLDKEWEVFQHCLAIYRLKREIA